MLLAGETKTRVLALMFIAAMIYGSFCSTACSLGACPTQAEQSARHECAHPSSANHSHGSRHSGPGRSDCYAHHHPTVTIVKADALPQFQLSKVGQIGIPQLLSELSGAPAADSRAPGFSTLGSPPISQAPLYEQISVLRI